MVGNFYTLPAKKQKVYRKKVEYRDDLKFLKAFSNIYFVDVFLQKI